MPLLVRLITLTSQACPAPTPPEASGVGGARVPALPPRTRVLPRHTWEWESVSRRFRPPPEQPPRAPLQEFRVQGAGFRVQGSGFRVQGSGFRGRGSGCRGQGSGCRVQGSGFRVQSSGFRVQGAEFRVQGSGCRVQG